MTETALHCDICGFVGDIKSSQVGDVCPRCSLTHLEVIDKVVAMHEKTYSHTCLRCDRTWESGLVTPSVCHYCNNRYWNSPRKNRVFGHPTSSSVGSMVMKRH